MYIRQLFTQKSCVFSIEVFPPKQTVNYEKLQEKLRQKLEAKTGKHVELTVKVEPDLIGGVKLTMGGVQYDGTVRHHLDELQRILQTNSN